MDSAEEIMQVCRLCLVKEAVNIPIFDEEGDDGRIFLKISTCLPVKVSKEDNLPKNICDGCSSKLEELYEFWNKSASSEKKLVKWLCQLELDKSDKMQHSMNTSDPVILKQEVVDVAEGDSTGDDLIPEDLNVSNDAPDYMLQQQLPYQPVEIQFQQDGFETTSENSLAEEKETKSKLCKRRAAAMKALASFQSEDEDDADLVNPKIAKTEDPSDESGEEPEPTAFVSLPSGDNEQPGPSGVGKSSNDAPFFGATDSNVTKVSVSTDTITAKDTHEQLFQKFEEKFGLKDCVVFLGDLKDLNLDKLQPSIAMLRRCFIHKNILVSVSTTKEEKVEETEIEQSINIFGKNYKKQLYLCKLCNEKFETELSLKRHKMIHFIKNKPKSNTKQIQHICYICRKTFMEYKSLLVHMKQHKSGSVQHHECKDCHQKYNSSNALNLHAHVCLQKSKTVSKYTPLKIERGFRYRCNICLKTFEDIYQMRHHKKLHYIEDESLSNNLSGTESISNVNKNCVNISSNFVNPVSGNTKSKFQYIRCNVCLKQFEDILQFRQHKKSHFKEDQTISNNPSGSIIGSNLEQNSLSPKFKCKICFKKFEDSHKLLKHKESHTQNRRPLKKQQGMWKFDWQRRNSAKHYDCKDCVRRFSTSSGLNLHIEECHRNSNITVKNSEVGFKYRCNVCLKKFEDILQMRQHKKSHYNEDPADTISNDLPSNKVDSISTNVDSISVLLVKPVLSDGPTATVLNLEESTSRIEEDKMVTTEPPSCVTADSDSINVLSTKAVLSNRSDSFSQVNTTLNFEQYTGIEKNTNILSPAQNIVTMELDNYVDIHSDSINTLSVTPDLSNVLDCILDLEHIRTIVENESISSPPQSATGLSNTICGDSGNVLSVKPKLCNEANYSSQDSAPLNSEHSNSIEGDRGVSSRLQDINAAIELNNSVSINSDLVNTLSSIPELSNEIDCGLECSALNLQHLGSIEENKSVSSEVQNIVIKELSNFVDNNSDLMNTLSLFPELSTGTDCVSECNTASNVGHGSSVEDKNVSDQAKTILSTELSNSVDDNCDLINTLAVTSELGSAPDFVTQDSTLNLGQANSIEEDKSICNELENIVIGKLDTSVDINSEHINVLLVKSEFSCEADYISQSNIPLISEAHTSSIKEQTFPPNLTQDLVILRCEICDDVFKNENSYLEHINFHKEIESLGKTNCDTEVESEFTQRIFVKNIMDLMPEQKETSLNVESTIKKTKDSLKIFKCDECLRVFKKSRSVRKHIRINKGKYKCNKCSYVTCGIVSLKAHFRAIHNCYMPSKANALKNV